MTTTTTKPETPARSRQSGFEMQFTVFAPVADLTDAGMVAETATKVSRITAELPEGVMLIAATKAKLVNKTV